MPGIHLSKTLLYAWVTPVAKSTENHLEVKGASTYFGAKLPK
jgi:hypothetical protein